VDEDAIKRKLNTLLEISQSSVLLLLTNATTIKIKILWE
jgi:hypothetical protein